MEKISEKSANKSVRFSEETDRKFSLLAEKMGRSKQELFAQMVDYFYKSKKDPGDLNNEVLKKEISQGINRIISFIKTQEKETLAPMLADVREGQQLTRQVDQTNATNWKAFIGRWQDYSQSWKKYEATFAQLFQLDDPIKPTKVDGFLPRRLTELSNKVGSLVQQSLVIDQEKERAEKRIQAIKAAHARLLGDYMSQREKLNALTGQKAIEQLRKDTYDQLQSLKDL
jgi:hypothetical protein